MSSEIQSPFKFLWEYNYPFKYWQNRVQKINPFNEQDRFEALYTAVLLSDIYTHVFAAKVRNPDLPWFVVKEETYRNNINSVLENLESDGFPLVENMLEHEDTMASIMTNEEYTIDELEALSIGLLGCPASIDDETQSVEFHEDPWLHRGVCNAILNYADGTKNLLNDFKHGFRVIPVTPDDLRLLTKEIMMFDSDGDKEYTRRTQELDKKLTDEGEWNFAFARMQTTKEDYGYDCQLDIYHVDAWACYKFSEVVLTALYNLIRPDGGKYLWEKVERTPGLGGEDGFSAIDHVMGFGLPLRDDPDTVLTKEEFQSG
ncbi:hypothetical protein [Natrarchaeobius oligotrophus]|uniref:Uncharacterized protein n=1 Tax=Natrarchaeobius chitinivorans TaxID=1679083 RepID=A0A3N6M470_NATCH|nr:hypothetical protein [Natrarchaeobius chitinivorans]RQG98308.1 hypothetical protein EA472_18010 [Natrarchaeobius chitinivorans]